MKLTVPAFLLLAISPMASHGAKLVEFGCRVMISDQEEMSALQTPELRVLDYNDDNQFVGFQAIGGFKPTAVLCVRSSVIPAPDDYQIVLGGFPFFIRVDRRIAVLETPGGKYALALTAERYFEPRTDPKNP